MEELIEEQSISRNPESGSVRDVIEEKIPVVFRPPRNKKCNYYVDCPTCDYKDLCEPYNNAKAIEDFCKSLCKITGKPDGEKYV